MIGSSREWNMPPIDLNPLYQQMGQVLQGLRALSESIEIRAAQTEKLHDLLRLDLTILRRDQKDLEEKLDCVICVMQHDLGGIRTEAQAHAGEIAQLAHAVQELRRPVAEIIALRSRAAGLILGLGVFGSALGWLVEPVYRWFMEHHDFK
jgi:hypothetical protein